LQRNSVLHGEKFATRCGLAAVAEEGIAHVEAAYREIDERIDQHLQHFDQLLETMRENYRSKLLEAKNDARV
jgi:hypothetical protein